MADIIPYIEQTYSSCNTSNPLEERNVPPLGGPEPQVEDLKNIEAEKVIVLSFRSLQLRRIAKLQDDLLRLAVITASSSTLPDGHKAAVDQALRDFGVFYNLIEPFKAEKRLTSLYSRSTPKL
jgi:hypothetical protein